LGIPREVKKLFIKKVGENSKERGKRKKVKLVLSPDKESVLT